MFAVDQSAMTGQVNAGCTLMMASASTNSCLKSFPSSSTGTSICITFPIREKWSTCYWWLLMWKPVFFTCVLFIRKQIKYVFDLYIYIWPFALVTVLHNLSISQFHAIIAQKWLLDTFCRSDSKELHSFSYLVFTQQRYRFVRNKSWWDFCFCSSDLGKWHNCELICLFKQVFTFTVSKWLS